MGQSIVIIGIEILLYSFLVCLYNIVVGTFNTFSIEYCCKGKYSFLNSYLMLYFIVIIPLAILYMTLSREFMIRHLLLLSSKSAFIQVMLKKSLKFLKIAQRMLIIVYRPSQHIYIQLYRSTFSSSSIIFLYREYSPSYSFNQQFRYFKNSLR